MAQFNDSYYDPPDDEDETCQICHYQPNDCTCPECKVCGNIGDPLCINKHMDWSEWGHFSFRLSDKEMKAELEAERLRNEAEAEAEKALDSLPWDMEPICDHRGYEDERVCGICGQLLQGPFEEIQIHRDDLEQE